jgi:hypothetical protein
VDEIATLRKELSRLGRFGATRSNAWTRSLPCDWSPGTVQNPTTGMPFTETSAWELICDLLDGEQEFELKVMDCPAGQVALITKAQLSDSGPVVYIKLHIYRGKALCRSFHVDLGRG